MLCSTAFILLALATQADAGAVNFRGSGRVSKLEATEILRMELTDVDHHMKQFEALVQMFNSLPKNAYGNLGHQAVRYALHRFFVDRYGWFIGGLEPAAASNASALPNILQAAFEGQVGERGVDLRGLTTLAAALEDLAEKESQVRLTDAYAANEVSSEGPTSHSDANAVLYTYLVSFLVSNNWTVSNLYDLAFKQNIFETKYREYNSTMAWAATLKSGILGDDATRAVSFDTVAKTAIEIGKTYHNYNELGCKDLRSTLNSMESKRPGRVRLSTFYNMSLHGLWDFTEKPEFLRALGALDESNLKQPSVIISNYAVSRLNCLNATNLYAICCRNLCDDLTGRLERELGAPEATVERIVELVSGLPSESVAAPRQLPAALTQRLEEVAERHGGLVPVHGRLFAQWMHHAYPLECPYPHEAGMVSAQTPEEWMAQTGAATQEASLEEMQLHVDADTCSVSLEGKVECGEETLDLPWSMTEELILGAASVKKAGQGEHVDPVLALIFLLAAVGIVVWVGAERVGGHQRWLILLSLTLAAAAYCADLLDGVVFLGAVIASALVVSAKGVVGRLACAKAGLLPMRQAKVV